MLIWSHESLMRFCSFYITILSLCVKLTLWQLHLLRLISQNLSTILSNFYGQIIVTCSIN